MKTNYNSTIPFINRKKAISRENLKEIHADAELYQKKEISISELVQKLKIIISQLNNSTKTFDLEYSYDQIVTLPFLNKVEAISLGAFERVKNSEKPKTHVLQAKKANHFLYQDKIDDYQKETFALANIINKLFGYLSADSYLKILILKASDNPSLKKELESIEIYKSVRFTDFRCAGTIFDKLNEYFVTNEALDFASDMAFLGKEIDKKDKRTFNRLNRIIKRVARKQRELHLLKGRKIGTTGELYCSNELLKYQHERDIEQQEFIDNTEVVYLRNGKEEKIPLAKFALTDERKSSEIYMKVKDLEKEADKKGYIALFTTFTCPPEYHSNPASGKNSWNGSTPRQASDWLSNRLIALNKDRERHEIDTLGMWCKEAHKDQCVHMHSMFFVHPNQEDNLITLINKHYAHSSNAVRIVRISKEEADKVGKKAASPASYITKYVIKSLREKSDESMKNKAVARLWGYRMYGFFGKTKTMLWRTYDRFFGKELNVLKLTLKNTVFLKLAELRQAGRFWEFCAYADEYVKPVIVEHETISWSGFEFIRKIKWGYRVIGTDECLQTKFDCQLKTKVSNM